MNGINKLGIKIVATLLLVALGGMVFSTLAMADHESGGGMAQDCPFAAPGTTFCPNNLWAATVHHLSAYYDYFNVPVSAGLATILTLLVFALFSYFLAAADYFQLKFSGNYLKLLDPPPRRDQTLVRWLALLENSPANF